MFWQVLPSWFVEGFDVYIYIYIYIYIYTGVKLSPTFGRCPRWLIFFRSVFYQNNWNNCKEVMNRGGGQIRGALYNFFVVKKCLFCIFQMYYNRFIKSFHEQVCLIIFNGRYYFDRYFSPPPPPFCSDGVDPRTKFSKREWAWQDLNL